jgi:cyanophycin synthetase
VASKKIFITGIPKPPSQNPAFDFWLDDKTLVKKKLADAGVPVPRGGKAHTWRQARIIFEKIEKPVVVKPRLGSRGRHTTTNISTLDDMKAAYHRAKQLCHWVVVEEHLVGSVYRSTLVAGRSCGILRGDPPRVVGDGVHTIAQLVDIKNAARHANVSAITLSESHRKFLSRIGHVPDDVLAIGEKIDLLDNIGVRTGGNSADDTSNIHPDTVAILENAARVLGDPLVGLDFIIPDIGKAPQGQKWGITECNACPFINLHYDPLEGESRNVAGDVWDMIERRIDDF